MPMKEQYIVRETTSHTEIEQVINQEPKNGYELVSLIVTQHTVRRYYTAVMKFKQ
jgi:hypothetical protein